MAKAIVAIVVMIVVADVLVVLRLRSRRGRTQWDRAARHVHPPSDTGPVRSVHVTSGVQPEEHTPPSRPRLHVDPTHVFGEPEPAPVPTAPRTRDVQRALNLAGRRSHRARWPRHHPRRRRRIAVVTVVAALVVIVTLVVAGH